MKYSNHGFRRRIARSARRSFSGRTGHSFFRSSPTGIFSSSEGTTSTFFQPKLAMGTPGDAYEKEADAVADKVVSNQGADSVSQHPGISPVQKADLLAQPEKEKEKPLQKMEEKKEEPVQKQEEEAAAAQPALEKKEEEKPVQKLEEKKEEEKPIQKMEKEEKEETVQSKGGASKDPSGASFVSQQLKQGSHGGHTLEAGVQQQMETSFGISFNHVKVHTDTRAQQMNKAIGAKAFTHGKDIYFNSGYFAPYNYAGKHLLAHELTHVVQQSGGKQATSMQASGNAIHREVELDPVTRLPTGNFLFHQDADLPVAFMTRFKRYLGDGSLTDEELNNLRLYAIAHRGTLTQAERLLMAAGLDPANLAAIQAHGHGTLSLPFANITAANRTHVNNIGRGTLSPEYEAATLRAITGFLAGDFEGALTILANLNETAIQEIFTIGGPAWRLQAEDLVAFIEIHHLPAVSVLSAMYNAASDSSPADQIMAGMVYATASHAGLSSASQIASGAIKVDAMSPSALSKLNNNQGGDAMYVPAGRNDRLKSDTIYVPTSLEVTNLIQRALIVHELTHAQDDAAVPAGVSIQPQVDLEIRAYRRQAQYILDQLLATAPENLAMELSATRRQSDSPLFQWAYMAEAKANSARYLPMASRILLQSATLTQADINNAQALTLAVILQRMQNALTALPQYAGNLNVMLDGLHGESILDHVN